MSCLNSDCCSWGSIAMRGPAGERGEKAERSSISAWLCRNQGIDAIHVSCRVGTAGPVTGIASLLLKTSGPEQEGHWTVVDEVDGHMGAEAAGFNRGVAGADGGQQGLEAGPGPAGRGGAAETRPHAAAGVGREGELRHQQQATAGVGEGTV